MAFKDVPLSYVNNYTQCVFRVKWMEVEGGRKQDVKCARHSRQTGYETVDESCPIVYCLVDIIQSENCSEFIF